MKRFFVAAGIAALLPVAACATTETTHYRGVDEQDYRISVEIPLDGLQIAPDEILKVNDLLDERTEFDATDFQLDEVVLIAKSTGDPGDTAAGGSAELLVLEWRSGKFDIPAGGEDDWYEVRIPAPDEDPGGAWLLDLKGDVTVDFLVVVMQPRPRVVAEKAVDRTRTVYRTVDGHRHAYPSTWIYDPTRYYAYHYYDDIWPYRYFAGVWDYRYYHVGFRPDYHRFGRYYGPRYDLVVWRDRYRPDRRRYRHGRDSDGWRLHDAGDSRPRARYNELKRTNTRLRAFHRQDDRRQASDVPTARQEQAETRYQQLKRTHPRLRQFHRNETANEDRRQDDASATTAENSPERTAAAPARVRESRLADLRRGNPSPRANSPPRQRVATPRRGNSPRQAATPSRRIPTSRSAPRARSVSTPAPSPSVRAPTGVSPSARPPRVNRQSARQVAPSARSNARAAPRPSANIRTRTFHQRRSEPTRTAPAAVARSTTPNTRASSRGIVRTRSFERAPQSRAAPVQPAPRATSSAPAGNRSSSNPRRREVQRR